MGALTILVTGAGGFLGAAVVAEARARGHEVRSLTRRPGGDVVCDLADGLPPGAAEGIDRVIHCAAALTGDEATMRRDTVEATRRIARAGLPMVLAGSIAVYDGMAREVDETTPVEPRPDLRDAYTRAKIAQEAAAAGPPLRLLRIGALWGPGHLWNAHLGVRLGPVLLRIGRGEIPLAHVRNAAAALVLAAEGKWTGTEIVNVVDDERPDAKGYLAAWRGTGRPTEAMAGAGAEGGFHPPYPVAAKECAEDRGFRSTSGGAGGGLSSSARARVGGDGFHPPCPVPFPFAALDLAARLLSPLAPRLPGLLRRPVLHARMAPRRYGNARLHALGWTPCVTFAQGMREAR